MHIFKRIRNRTNNTENVFNLTLCGWEFVLPPPPGLRTGGTPLINAGGKEAYRVGLRATAMTVLRIPRSPSADKPRKTTKYPLPGSGYSATKKERKMKKTCLNRLTLLYL